MQLVGIMDAAQFKDKVMEVRDGFVQGNTSGARNAAEADGEMLVVLRDIHTSLEGLRSDLRQN